MKTYELEYIEGQQKLRGFVAEPTNIKKDTAVILIVHMWSGRSDFVIEKAKDMAKEGYIGFAIDMFGDAVIGQSVEENTQLIQPFMQDRKLMQSRVQAAFNAIKQIENADINNVLAMGYCFGGLCVQDLARVNDVVKGIISIHGLMLKADNISQGKFTAKVLLLHGSDDPMVSDENWLDLRSELSNAECDWQKHDFGGVMHAFTNPLANDKSMGTVYNKNADQRSSRLILDFIDECLNK